MSFLTLDANVTRNSWGSERGRRGHRCAVSDLGRDLRVGSVLCAGGSNLDTDLLRSHWCRHGAGLKPLELELDPHLIKVVAEVTLVWVLFADASRVRIADLRVDRGLYLRLLALGLPMTIALGAFAAAVVLGVVRGMPSSWVPPWPRLTRPSAPQSCRIGGYLVESARPSTSKVASTTALPPRRHLLSQASQPRPAGPRSPGHVLIGLLLGVVSGVVVGAGGGALLRLARRRGWSSDEFAGPAVLALALLAYLVRC